MKKENIPPIIIIIVSILFMTVIYPLKDIDTKAIISVFVLGTAFGYLINQMLSIRKSKE